MERSVGELKREIRKRVKLLVEEHSGELEGLSCSLCGRIVEAQYLEWADTVLAYMPLFDEVDVLPLLKKCLDEGKEVFVPRVDMESLTMDFFRYSGQPLEEGSYGIREPGIGTDASQPVLVPEKLEGRRILVLTPGRAFSSKGVRLGRGKGFYDKYFARLENCPSDLLVAGVCFPFQVMEDIPFEEHDRKMDVLFV